MARPHGVSDVCKMIRMEKLLNMTSEHSLKAPQEATHTHTYVYTHMYEYADGDDRMCHCVRDGVREGGRGREREGLVVIKVVC